MIGPAELRQVPRVAVADEQPVAGRIRSGRDDPASQRKTIFSANGRAPHRQLKRSRWVNQPVC